MKKLITKNICKLLLPTVAAGAMLCSLSANAQILLPGPIPIGDDITPAGNGAPGYIASSAAAFSFDGGADAGTLYTYVYAPTVDPANLLGGDTFVYVISMNTSPSALLGELEVNGYSSTGGNVLFGYGSTSTVAPIAASYALGTINFNWIPATAGGGTYYAVVGTALTTIADNTGTLQDGGTSGDLSILAPTAVPEASTIMAGALMILPLGFGAFRALRKERMA